MLAVVNQYLSGGHKLFPRQSRSRPLLHPWLSFDYTNKEMVFERMNAHKTVNLTIVKKTFVCHMTSTHNPNSVVTDVKCTLFV